MEQRLDELNADCNLACGVIKRFIRELKTPLINEEILSAFEKCDSNVSDKDVNAKVDHLKKVISKMYQPNLDTFSYLIMHFHRVLNHVCYFCFVPIFNNRSTRKKYSQITNFVNL